MIPLPGSGYNWRYRALALLNPMNWVRWVRWNVQRMNRGFSDYDWWGFHDYLSEVCIAALEQFKDGNGLPLNPEKPFPEALTREEWNAKLDTMIAGFKAAQDIANLNYGYESPGDEAYDRWYTEREATRRKGFAEFTEWYLALWD